MLSQSDFSIRNLTAWPLLKWQNSPLFRPEKNWKKRQNKNSEGEFCSMGANSQQGWALFLFLLGFTFLVAGLYGLGPLFVIGSLVCLIVSTVWFIRIKPLEHSEPTKA
jgi:hypothetical protein